MARATLQQLRPALSELYRTRASSYRDGLREFVLAYREAYAEVLQVCHFVFILRKGMGLEPWVPTGVHPFSVAVPGDFEAPAVPLCHGLIRRSAQRWSQACQCESRRAGFILTQGEKEAGAAHRAEQGAPPGTGSTEGSASSKKGSSEPIEGMVPSALSEKEASSTGPAGTRGKDAVSER